MALEIASIVPWKWNLRERTILCDVNRPIELGGLDGDVREEQLSVPDTQYFAKIRREDRERVRRAYRDLAEGRVAKVKEEYRVIVGEGRGRRQEWVEAQAAVEDMGWIGQTAGAGRFVAGDYRAEEDGARVDVGQRPGGRVQPAQVGFPR